MTTKRAADGANRSIFGTGPDAARTLLNSFVSSTCSVKTLPEQLSYRLVEMIVGGELKAGERLQELTLSDQFAVSRGPVREALRLLEREGLVTIEPRRGATVAVLTPERVRNIFAVRAALLALCAEDLARRRPAGVVDALDEGTTILGRALKQSQTLEFVILVYQLSMYLADHAGNALARDILATLSRQTLSLTRRAMETADHRRAWASNWQGIVQGIRDGDPVRAGHATSHLVETVRDAALNALEDFPAEDGGSRH